MNKKNVDWEKFIERKGINKSEVAKQLGAAPAMLTGWINGTNAPGFFYLQKLAKIGMTAQEMFGEEIGDAMVKNSIDSPTALNPEFYDTPGFRDGVMKVLEEYRKGGGKNLEKPDRLSNNLEKPSGLK